MAVFMHNILEIYSSSLKLAGIVLAINGSLKSTTCVVVPCVACASDVHH